MHLPLVYNRVVKRYHFSGTKTMNKIVYPLIAVLLFIVSVANADIFTHRQTGETFYGYSTQRTMDTRMRIYEQIDDKFDAKIIDTADYDVKYDPKGRRDTVVVIPINQKEALISKAVADTLAQTIQQAADHGPLSIIIEIDSPGGRGDYMSIVTKAITDTTNCPVAAYITGDTFGGAYSTAAAIALACDKIYISPTAAIGSVAPAHGAMTAQTGFDDYIKTYNPANISTYAAYIARLAENKGRPGILGAALMDKSIEVLEVKTENEGTKFINAIDKIPAQQLIKRWSQTINASAAPADDDSSQMNDYNNTGKTSILTLIGDQAVHCKLADKVAITQSDVLADLKAENARVIKNTNAIAICGLFDKNQRTMDRLISSIRQKEEIADRIDSQLNELIVKQNNNIDIKVVGSNQNTNNTLRNFGSSFNDADGIVYSTRQRNEMRKEQRKLQDQQYTQVDQDTILRSQLTNDLANILKGLAGDYKQAIAIGRKFPGAVPADISVSLIESKLTAVRMKLRTL